jgi:predicted phage tail protein
MVTVLLYGHLAQQFGKTHLLDINSPAEAIRALCANYKTFRQSLILDGQAAYRVLVGNQDRADSVALPCGESKTIKIIPVIAGSSGIGKIFLGAALIAASFYLPGAGAAGLSISSVASSVGVSMLLGGISSLLFAPPKPQGSSERPENKPSYNFNGPINTTQQGNCVPICYGRLRVGSQVISAGTETANL